MFFIGVKINDWVESVLNVWKFEYEEKERKSKRLLYWDDPTNFVDFDIILKESKQ